MRKHFKQFLVFLLTLAMCMSSVAAVQPDTSSETDAQASALTYVVVNSPELETPDSQEILIGIGDADTSIEAAALTIRNQDTGETTEYDAEELTDGAALFRVDYTAKQAGTYELVSVRYTCGGVETETVLADLDIQAAFGVNTEADSEPDAVVVENTSEDSTESAATENSAPDVVVDVTSLNDGGDEDVAAAVEEALFDAAADADSDDGIAAFSMDGASTFSARSNKTYVVVLDPGHGTRKKASSPLDPGTSFSYNGRTYEEKDLTLKIAQYCKQELEQYANVKVYMTRTGDYNGVMSIKDRVKLAADNRADILVSFHLNSAGEGPTTAKGAEVYYPNANGANGAVSADAKQLSEQILNQLVAVGLTPHAGGLHIRNASEDKYEDGSAMDYLGINRYSKEYGFPGVLIEHAYLNNKNEFYSFLSDDSKLKKLGVADATGIANYLGLTKNATSTPVVDPASPPTVTQDLANGQLSLSLNASGDTKAVRFYVWSAENGQDDMRTYDGVKQSNGTWTNTAPLNRHKGYGDYCIHCYVQDGQGWHFSSGVTINVQKLTASAEAVTTSTSTGAFRINVTDVNLPDAVKQIRVAVWSNANGQDDLIWTNATRSGNTWSIDVDPASHNYETGIYNIHVYAQDTIGNWYAVRCINHTISGTTVPQTFVTAAWDQGSGHLNITLSNYRVPSNLKQIRFAVWSLENGQDDLVWYNGTQQSDGTFTYSVPLSRHATYGSYAIHCYATTTSGSSFVAGTGIDIPKITANASVTVTDNNTGNFRINVTDINAPAAVSAMRIAVWSADNGQDDLIWTDATKSGNDWYIDVSTYDHGYDTGNYNIHIYVKDTTTGRWYAARCINHTVSISSQNPSLTCTWDAANAQLNIKLTNCLLPKNVNVRFAVWSAENGQDDLAWYTATRQSDGSWIYSVPLTKHRSYGEYYIHCYSTANRFLAGATTKVDKVTAAATATTTSDLTGTFRINVQDINQPDAIKEMCIAVWSSVNGQDDLIWKTATRQGNSWYLDVNTADHKYDTGYYCIHIYVRDTMSGWYAVRCINQMVNIPQVEAKLAVNMDSNTDYMNITLSNALVDPSSSSIRMAVWSNLNGQDDLVWYTAAYDSSTRTFKIRVPMSEHNYDTGVYIVHCYYYHGSTSQFLAGSALTPYSGARQTSAEITSATAKTIWQYFRSKGLSEAGTAALMGNLYAESGLNPRLLEKGKLAYMTTDTYNEALDNGTYLYSNYTNMRDSFAHDRTGYGLAQWTYYTRKQALFDYAQERGTSLSDLNMQLDFLWQELTHSYPTVVSALRTATSVKTASDIVLTQYERPANQDNSVKEKRANYGRAYFGYYA